MFPSQWCGMGMSCIVKQLMDVVWLVRRPLVALSVGECSTHLWIHVLLMLWIVILTQQST